MEMEVMKTELLKRLRCLAAVTLITDETFGDGAGGLIWLLAGLVTGVVLWLLFL
jgi:hypothetical protein